MKANEIPLSELRTASDDTVRWHTAFENLSRV